MAINKRIIRSNDEGGAGLSFNTVLYTGTNSSLPITGLGFQPDLVWIKNRTGSVDHHSWIDSVRGKNSQLFSNLTNGENTFTDQLDSFDSDGFTVGTGFIGTEAGRITNVSGVDYVAWCWKAGGAAVTNTDGSITSQVSANTEAGFSIVKYTATGGGNYSVGHGLSQTPDFVIVKPTSENVGWTIWSSTFPNLTKSYINFTTMAVNTPAITVWGSGMTSTVIGQTSGVTSNPNQSLIAYAFHSVAGFSKFGSYSGTDAAGNYVETGFEPAFVLIKRSIAGAGNWIMKDNKRNPTNPVTNNLYANLSNEANDITTLSIDFNPLGFTVNGTSGDVNDTGTNNYIYMAFANQF